MSRIGWLVQQAAREQLIPLEEECCIRRHSLFCEESDCPEKRAGFQARPHPSFFFGCHALEIRSSAEREPKGSVEVPVKPVTAVGVVSGAGDVIELANACHNGARVLLLHRLSSRGHQRLN